MRAGSRVPFPPGTPGAPAGCCVCRVRSCPGLWHCRTFHRHKGDPPLPTPVSAYPPFSSRVLSFEVVFSQRARRPGDPFRLLVPLPTRAPAPEERRGLSSRGRCAWAAAQSPSVATDLSLTLTSLAIPSLPSPLRGLPGSRAGFHVDGSPYSLGPGLTRATAGPSREWMFPFLGQTRCFPECLYVVHPTSCV